MLFSTGTGFTLEISWLLILFTAFVAWIAVRKFRKRGNRKAAEKSNGQFTHPDKELATSYKKASRCIAQIKDSDAVIAVVDVNGTILDESSGSLSLPQRATYGVNLGNTLREISREKNLSAVLIRMSTPGGTLPGSSEIADGINACNEAGIHTIAYVPSLSASGGMWAMAPAQEIIAHPYAMIGSIGVRGPRLLHCENATAYGNVFEGFFKAEKITSETLHAGNGKTLGDPLSEDDPKAKSIFQKSLTDAYEAFVDHVVRHRNCDAKTLREEIGAAVVDASYAQRLGLISETGNFDAVRKRISEILETQWERCTVVHIKPQAAQGFNALASSALTCAPWLSETIIKSELDTHAALVLWKD